MNNTTILPRLLFAICMVGVVSCSETKDKTPITDDAAQWSIFVKKLENEIGPKGGYADINYQPLRENDAPMLVQLSTDTASADWKECTYRSGSFSTKQRIKFDGKDGATPGDFLYTLKDYDLSHVPKLVQQCREKLAKEKNVAGTSTVLMSINSPTIKTKDFEEEFNVVIWQLAPSTGIYYTFRFNYKDSCEAMSELPKGYKL
jgi:hypothetical protein